MNSNAISAIVIAVEFALRAVCVYAILRVTLTLFRINKNEKIEKNSTRRLPTSRKSAGRAPGAHRAKKTIYAAPARSGSSAGKQSWRCSAMTTNDLLEALARLRVETGSLACLGCGHEHNCSTHGCAILRVAADLIERLTAENAKAEAERDALREKVPRWISVDDRHPKPGTRVLATDGVFVGEAYRTSADTWRRYDGIAMRDCIGSVVTHWMPLPEAPAAAEEGEKV